MKLRVRMCFFLSVFLSLLLFIHYPILHPQSTQLPRINYFNRNGSNITFTQIHESLLLQFSFDDHRRGNMGTRSLRILFVAKKKRPKLICVLDDKKEVEGTWYEMSENHGKEYGVYVLSCTIPPNTQHLHTFRITVPTKEWLSRELSVDYVIPEREPKEFRMDYATCSPLVFGGKYTREHLIEFVEMNRLLGVERISLYIDYASMSKEFISTVKFYQTQGILDAVGYHEPVKGIWYHGQLGLIMDCLVRHATTTRFVAFHDLDELIVSPTGNKTVDVLSRLLEGRKISLRVSTQAMSISNSTRPHLLSNIASDSTADEIFTKCIVRPFHVFEQGIHHTSRTIFDTNTLERADFSHLRVFHFKHKHVFESVDTTIREHYGEKLSESYFMALKQMTL